MPPKKDAAASSSSALAALDKRVSLLETRAKKPDLRALTIQKKDLLNAEAKSYSDNLYIKGMKYLIRDVQGDEVKEEAFRETVLKLLVDQGLIPAKSVFTQKGSDAGQIIRGILRHAHPLAPRDNSTVVCAFTESWFAGQINGKLNSGLKLKNNIRISSHLPPILDQKRNEALKARRQIMSADPSRKIILHKMVKSPWIKLLELKNGKKTPIDWPVDDARLINPARTLAKLELEGRDTFTPKMFLPPALRSKIKSGVVKAMPSRGGGDDDDDDDDDDDEEAGDDSAMQWGDE